MTELVAKLVEHMVPERDIPRASTCISTSRGVAVGTLSMSRLASKDNFDSLGSACLDMALGDEKYRGESLVGHYSVSEVRKFSGEMCGGRNLVCRNRIYT